MALFRTVMIGLICAGFTTQCWAPNTNPDGLHGAIRQNEKSHNRVEPCENPITDKDGLVLNKNSNAWGKCDSNKKWSFEKCAKGTDRVLYADIAYSEDLDDNLSGDFTQYIKRIEGYCAYPVCPKDWLPIMGTFKEVTGRIKFKNGSFCRNSAKFCNTQAAKDAFEHATNVKEKTETIAEIQKLINKMSDTEKTEFFANLDTTQYQEYCCAIYCFWQSYSRTKRSISYRSQGSRKDCRNDW